MGSNTLLTRGNSKLGSSIGAFSLPHATIQDCPGSSELCRKACYVTKYQRRFKLDYSKNRAAAEAHSFVDSMSKEAGLYRVVRVHVAGDFYSAEYTRKWSEICRRSPGTLFFAYTRSWNTSDVHLKQALIELSREPNFQLNISADKQTGVPNWLELAFGPKSLAYMSTEDSDYPEAKAGIVFRTKQSTVKAKLNGSTVCPAENGISNSVTCGSCRLCFKAKL